MLRREFLTLAGVGAVLPLVQPELAQAAKAAPGRVLTQLPKSQTKRLAWTVDDGASTHTVGAYVDLLERNPDLHITFFVTSAYGAWRKYGRRLLSLQDQGQVQLANHTHTHPDLTSLSDRRVRHELLDCKNFLRDHFGVTGEPFYRPPYGYFDNKVRSIAADLGYTDTVMWLGTFADSGKTTSNGILRNAKKWMTNRHIVIAHANQPTVIADFNAILETLGNRGLETVTLDQAFR
jgi:hypothetical protein